MAKRIYVGNLPYSVDSGQLASLFGEYGQVVEATVITDRDTGQSKGFGFVQMADDGEAMQAISRLDGSQLGNRTIRVNEAQPRTDRMGGGGRGGRDMRGGGGGRSWGSYDTGYEASPRWNDGGPSRRRDRGW